VISLHVQWQTDSSVQQEADANAENKQNHEVTDTVQVEEEQSIN
jgi:hypothetical protein